jgi:hypothetical protein
MRHLAMLALILNLLFALRSALRTRAPWAELLRKTFGFEIVCQKCQSPLRLIALIKNGDIAKKILTAMHLPSMVPELHPAHWV